MTGGSLQHGGSNSGNRTLKITPSLGEESINKQSLAVSSAYPGTESHLTSFNSDCFNITSSVAVNKHFHRLVLPM